MFTTRNETEYHHQLETVNECRFLDKTGLCQLALLSAAWVLYLNFSFLYWHDTPTYDNVCHGSKELMHFYWFYKTLQIVSFINFVFNVNFQLLSTIIRKTWRLRSQMITEWNTKSMKLSSSHHATSTTLQVPIHPYP